MLIGILTLITALTISAVAIYYSVAGLMTIFAAAALPIMIMGGALEIGKLVTAVWLHRYWREAAWWLKTYLVAAVVVLMFITSMGIFGFLSKAHIEQTASAANSVAQIERIEDQITRNEQIVERAQLRVLELENTGSSVVNQLQDQIELEQQRIDTAYDRIQPAIDEQNRIIEQQTALFEQELANIDRDLDALQTFINEGNIERAQAMVGVSADGNFGPGTARAFQEYQDERLAERAQWLERIQVAQQSDIVVAAREEISRLRSEVEQQIAASNALINNLREQLQSNETVSVQSLLAEQNQRILVAQAEIDQLMEQKFELESEYRILEAEVGPVMYIAEFIYGDSADDDLLEEAVRWVIVIIIFVFDPLAVLLLIASQFTFEQYQTTGQKNRKTKGKGVQNVTKTRPYRKAKKSAVTSQTRTRQEGRDVAQGLDVASEQLTTQSATSNNLENKDNPPEVNPSENSNLNADFEIDIDDFSNDPSNDTVEQAERRKIYNELIGIESSKRIANNDASHNDNVPSLEKKDIKSLQGSKRLTEKELELLDQDHDWQEAKRIWKEANPDLTLKEYKRLYLAGEIDQLPWEDYLDPKKKNYLTKQEGQQIRKEAK